MKRVAIIGTVGIPARYGGFETLVEHLTKNLSKKYDLKVYCSGKTYKKEERKKYYNGARLHFLPFNANGAQSIIYDIISIFHALFVADTLLILGVSGGIVVPFVKIFTRKTIIVNIDGLEWRRAKWGKYTKRFLKFSERVAVKYSHADITDNMGIKRYTSINYKTLSTLIEYGGDHVLKVKPTHDDIKIYPFLKNTYAFKVARIEPENNIHVILEAFEESSKTLVVVGNWDNSEYGRDLKNKYLNHKRILLLDPIYNQRELDVLRSNCFLYVHGHSAGGTNPSLVEAMNLELPIIAFDCVYNRYTTEDKGLYFKRSTDLNKIINNLEVSSLMEVKSNMSKIGKTRYTWLNISKKYSNLIESFSFNYKKSKVNSKLSKMKDEELKEEGMLHLKNQKYYYEK